MTGYVLDRAIAAWLETCARIGAVTQPASIAETRAGYDRICRHFSRPHPDGLSAKGLRIAGVPCRLYRPEGAAKGAFIYYHGGGWVVGNLDSHDSIVAELAVGTGLVGLAVDYRLAPEHPFPAAFDDALAVFRAVRDDAAGHGIDPARIVLAGDSAGGNLAAAVSTVLRDRGEPGPCGQALIYPALSGDFELPSRRAMADAPGLTLADLHKFLELYLGRAPMDGDARDMRLHPAGAASYAGLPPTFLTAAEYDPLASDVPDYAMRLRSAGVPVDAVVEMGLPHAWLRARHDARPAMAAFERLVAAMRRLAAT